MPEEKLTIIDIIKGIFYLVFMYALAIAMFGLLGLIIIFPLVIFLNSDLNVVLKTFIVTLIFVLFVVAYSFGKVSGDIGLAKGPPAHGIRVGNRVPTGSRSALRRSRTATACRAHADRRAARESAAS